MLLFAIAGKAKLDFLYGSVTIYVKVQDGGKKVCRPEMLSRNKETRSG